MELLARFKKTCLEHSLLKENDRVLVGLSGGPDSMTLLHLLGRLDMNLSLEIFHLDHSLREEAMAEAKKVVAIANGLALPCHCFKRDVKKIYQEQGGSLQEVARNVRLELLRKVAAERGLNVIALGHQADDQVETLLINLLRGSGLTGLGGIAYRGQFGIIHPLLDIWREEIEDYCRKYSLETIQDQSNLQSKYRRNSVRLELIPVLETYNPNVKKALWQTAKLLQEDSSCLSQFADEKIDRLLKKQNISSFDNMIKIELTALEGLANPFLRRFLFYLLNKISSDRIFYFAHVEAILELIKEGKTGERLSLPGSLILEKGSKYLCFFPKEDELEVAPFSHVLTIPGEIKIPEIGMVITALVHNERINVEALATPQREFFDGDRIAEDLLVRNRRQGDRFFPLGSPGEKKLKDFFIDAKVDKYLRDRIPLLETADGDIVWVAGYRIAHRYRVRPESKKIIEISCREIN